MSSPSLRLALDENETRKTTEYLSAGRYLVVCLREFKQVGLRTSSTAGPFTGRFGMTI